MQTFKNNLSDYSNLPTKRGKIIEKGEKHKKKKPGFVGERMSRRPAEKDFKSGSLFLGRQGSYQKKKNRPLSRARTFFVRKGEGRKQTQPQWACRESGLSNLTSCATRGGKTSTAISSGKKNAHIYEITNGGSGTIRM